MSKTSHETQTHTTRAELAVYRTITGFVQGVHGGASTNAGTTRFRPSAVLRVLVVLALLLALSTSPVGATPHNASHTSTPGSAAAQPNAQAAGLFCNGSSTTGLGRLLNLGFQLSFYLGIAGSIMMLQIEKLREVVSLSRDAIREAKQREQQITKAAAMLVIIPLLARFLLPQMGIGLGSCIDLVPFF